METIEIPAEEILLCRLLLHKTKYSSGMIGFKFEYKGFNVRVQAGSLSLTRGGESTYIYTGEHGDTVDRLIRDLYDLAKSEHRRSMIEEALK